MNSLNMKPENVRKVFIKVNLDLLFDFKSIMTAITRFYAENTENFKIKNLNEKFFKSIRLNNIEQFVEDVVERFEFDQEVNFNCTDKKFRLDLKLALKENMHNCTTFKCVKPRLYFLFRFYFLTNFIKRKFSEEIQIEISSNEDFFVKIANKLNISSLFENLFELKKNSVLLKVVDSSIQEVDVSSNENNLQKENTIYINFDNKHMKLDELIGSSLKFSENMFNFYPNTNLLTSENVFEGKINFSTEHLYTYEKFLENILKKLNLNVEEELNNYRDALNNEFIQKYSKSFLTHDYKFINLWKNYRYFDEKEIVIIEGKVIPGFKRGSKLLGVPTANIEITRKVNNSANVLKNLLNGVYFGKYQFISDEDRIVYKSVLSIGYNPYFENSFKTLEIFLIDYEGEDFYDAQCKLTIEGFVRNESAFENFSELVTAINYDIIVSYFQ